MPHSSADATTRGFIPHPAYRPGQRVFVLHGATQEHLVGRVVSVHPGEVFPYLVETGDGTTIRVLSAEVQSDLPPAPVGWDGLVDWLGSEQA